MRMRQHLMRTVGAVLTGGVLVVAPAAIATAAPSTDADTSLPAPVLTSATIQGDNVMLVWQTQQDNILDYAVYADGNFEFRTGLEGRAEVFLASEGLDGHEVFTVRAEGAVAPDGTPIDESPASNGLVASAPVQLPAPVMTSGSYDSRAGTITMNWTPSHTNEVSGHLFYTVIAKGDHAGYTDPGVAIVEDATTATFPLAQAGGLYFVSPTDQYYVYAYDLTFFSRSGPSNQLVPTQL